MLKYLKASFRRKIARRFTKEYPATIENFQVKGLGNIEFANWSNPLAAPVELNTNMIAFFQRFIKEGDMAIDIGANIGDTTVPIGLCTGKTGLTLGFDPNPYVFKILEVNASLNKDKTNIVPIPYAIAKQEEEYYFISSEASFGNGGISLSKESKHGKFIYPKKIKGVQLKNYLEENYKDRLPRFSFIKIDTEGYDKEVLKSIGDLITAYKPTIIAESFGKASNEDKVELYEVIDQLGYTIYHFEDFDISAKVEQLAEKNDITRFKHTINIYAIPKKD